MRKRVKKIYRINDIITSTIEEYNHIIKAAALLESMFGVNVETPGFIIKSIDRVLREEQVPQTIKKFLSDARELVVKYGVKVCVNTKKKNYMEYKRDHSSFLAQKYRHIGFSIGRQRIVSANRYK